MPSDEPTASDAEQVAVIILRLRRCGWNVRDVGFIGPAGRVRVVSGHNGENLIRAHGRTEFEAWSRALEQARALGMLAP